MTIPIIPDYAALENAAVATDPFPHAIVPHFIGPQDLRAAVASLPVFASGGSYPPSALRLSPLIRDLVAELEGPRLRDIIAAKFGLDLHGAPTMLTLRGRTRAQDGRIHRDSVCKRVTVLLYLNVDDTTWTRHEGCLRLLRGEHDIEDYATEVAPVNGTLLVFPNGTNTWHGHRRYVGARNTIQLNYMTDDSRARGELRRHRLSALTKRLRIAA
ncbi:2OG-Fe(II) oxygenase [Gluconacetobacter entanii]|uniref:2OG-Fe(II) oxygenase n=1 Tax=Gluconacetobacter entanii TaxID=108528 RepID=A0ABT3K5I1_9PROT|nr:2OG-Fe(II) oxygenase [Gluconacetobacter entanii]MCW4590668.1 2OG-Fe(II) oxygenase [Gluconacetobacter entanii]MCW4592952.1 2OG-Fe(II) oxygenase [Gluconacetobacter entanii]NPC88424.1 2OG-Fe(II) oxygenase [Gluconacetobacter entanii]